MTVMDDVHKRSDVDNGLRALHHTLGEGPGQAAPGSSQPPTGSILMYTNGTAPRGWLACDGSAISRTRFRRLFAIMGTAYGVGDGATTFNLPDMRLQFPRGPNVPAAIGGSGGTSSHTHGTTALSNSSSGAHDHGSNTGGYAIPNVSTTTGGGALVRNNDTSTHNHSIVQSANHTHSISGSADASANLPPYVYVQFIIKV